MRFIVLALVAAFSIVAGITLQQASAQGTSQGTADLVARGQYLVVSAGKCADCHGEQLQGGPLDFLKPGLPVAYQAPRIAGLPQLSAGDAATFLQTGNLPGGKQATPPMPQYRFSHDDAVAIVAYLKSLK